MDFTKIQPEQYQLPTFFSNSGDFSFSNLITGFKIELNRNLVGDFNIAGDLTVNGDTLLFIDDSVVHNKQRGGMKVGGQDNVVSGDNNIVVGGSGNTLYGDTNVILNANNSTMNSGANQNTLLCGNTVSFASGVTGSVFLGDNVSVFSVVQSKKLIIDFSSGTRFLNETVFEDNITVTGNSSFDGNLSIDGSITATGATFFNGNVEASGNLTVSGDRVPRFPDITGASGSAALIRDNGITGLGVGVLDIDLGGRTFRVSGIYS